MLEKFLSFIRKKCIYIFFIQVIVFAIFYSLAWQNSDGTAFLVSENYNYKEFTLNEYLTTYSNRHNVSFQYYKNSNNFIAKDYYVFIDNSNVEYLLRHYFRFNESNLEFLDTNNITQNLVYLENPNFNYKPIKLQDSYFLYNYSNYSRENLENSIFDVHLSNKTINYYRYPIPNYNYYNYYSIEDNNLQNYYFLANFVSNYIELLNLEDKEYVDFILFYFYLKEFENYCNVSNIRGDFVVPNLEKEIIQKELDKLGNLKIYDQTFGHTYKTSLFMSILNNNKARLNFLSKNINNFRCLNNSKDFNFNYSRYYKLGEKITDNMFLITQIGSDLQDLGKKSNNFYLIQKEIRLRQLSFTDFLYFSLSTSLLGNFADIVPTNTFTRGLVVFQQFIGLILFAFILEKLYFLSQYKKRRIEKKVKFEFKCFESVYLEYLVGLKKFTNYKRRIFLRDLEKFELKYSKYIDDELYNQIFDLKDKIKK